MLTILTITACLRLRQEDYRKQEISLGYRRMVANRKSPGEDLLGFIVTGFSSAFPLDLGEGGDVVSLRHTDHRLSRSIWCLSVGHWWVCLFGPGCERVRLPVGCYLGTTG